MHAVIFLPAAQIEASEAQDWYEAEARGLGSAVTQVQCDHIADDLNNRPRKRFGFDTPASLYHRN